MTLLISVIVTAIATILVVYKDKLSYQARYYICYVALMLSLAAHMIKFVIG